MHKESAADAEIDKELDALYDARQHTTAKYENLQQLTKTSDDSPWEYAKNTAGGLGSLYLTFALLSALGAGGHAYSYFNNRSQRKVMEKALRRRAKERRGGMAPIYLTPEGAV
jgi:hypothetical protein